MKTTSKLLVAALALGTSLFAASAQDNSNDGPPFGGPPGNGQRGPGPGSQGPGGQGMRGQRPPAPAIIGALDANHDGVIDADEIANASAALKQLDKNGDGKLTRDEFMGPRPQRPQGQNQGRPPGQGRNFGDAGNRPPGPPPGDGGNNNDGPPGPPPGEN